MAELTVDMTYGEALLLAAQDVGKTEEILEEAQSMVEIFQNEPSFFEFLSTPIISAQEKKDVLKNVFKDRVSPELINLLYILIDKSRGSHFIKIVERYKNLLDEREGFSKGTIVSAVQLSESQLSDFEVQTGKLLQKKVKLENKLDPKVIGGVRVFIEGKIIDATVQKRLSDMRESMTIDR